MKIIRTVTGDIAPDALGVTQAHEHLVCDTTLGAGEAPFPGLSGHMVLKDTAALTQELKDYYAAGGRGMVEATVHGWGRDVQALKEMSCQSGVHIIATSGFYTQDYIPAFARTAPPEALADFLVREVTTGVFDSGIRAGLLKSACAYPVIEGLEKKCAQAVGQAARISGAAITTHSPAAGRFESRGGNLGTQFLAIFEAQGVDPARVIIGHADQNADVRQFIALAKRGVYIEFDVIGKNHRLLDATRIELLAKMANAGLEDRILLSNDHCRMAECKSHGGPGYDELLLRFVPRLRLAGFDDRLLHKFLVENPARIFAIEIAEPEPKGDNRP